MKKIALVCLALAPLVSGCGWAVGGDDSGGEEIGPNNYNPDASVDTEHSSTLDTNQMTASMSAQSDGTTIRIYAAVFDASTSYGVTLDQGDFFTASTGPGDPVVLVLEPSPDTPYVVQYSASLPASSRAQDVTIAFVRQNGQTGAPQTTIHVPAPFDVTTTGSTTVNYGDSIPINAAPPPTDDILLEATGSCLSPVISGYDPNTFDGLVTFDSNGNGAIATGLLSFSDNVTDGAACSVQFYVSALSEGSLDPAFAGGATDSAQDVEGSQKRGVAATVTP